MYPDCANPALYAEASGGSVGSAQNILEGGYYGRLLADAFSLTETDLFRLPQTVRRVGETPYKKELLAILRLIFRDALILKTARINGVERSSRRGNRAEKYLLLRSEKEKLYAVAGNYTVRALVWAQEALSEAEKEIRFNAAFPQCLEVCLSGILEKNF